MERCIETDLPDAGGTRRPCTSSESKNLLAQLTAIVETLEMERPNSTTQKKEKVKQVSRIQEAGGCIRDSTETGTV